MSQGTVDLVWFASPSRGVWGQAVTGNLKSWLASPGILPSQLHHLVLPGKTRCGSQRKMLCCSWERAVCCHLRLTIKTTLVFPSTHLFLLSIKNLSKSKKPSSLQIPWTHSLKMVNQNNKAVLGLSPVDPHTTLYHQIYDKFWNYLGICFMYNKFSNGILFLTPRKIFDTHWEFAELGCHCWQRWFFLRYIRGSL